MARIRVRRSTIIMIITRISSAKVSSSLRKLSLSTDGERLYRPAILSRPLTRPATSSPQSATTLSYGKLPARAIDDSMMASTILRSASTLLHRVTAVSIADSTGLKPKRSRSTVPADATAAMLFTSRRRCSRELASLSAVRRIRASERALTRSSLLKNSSGMIMCKYRCRTGARQMRVSPSNLLNAQSYAFFAKGQNYFSAHFSHIFASI